MANDAPQPGFPARVKERLQSATLTLKSSWLEKVWPRLPKAWRAAKSIIQRYYLDGLITIGIFIFAVVLFTYIWQIPILIGKMLGALRTDWDIRIKSTADIRNIGYTFAALAGMLAILATIPFQLVRVWINERTATTQEANLTTGLINTAVEGLGAEKKVSRIGRPVTFSKEGEPNHTAIEWQDDDPPAPPGEGWKLEERGDWQTFDQTRPNLEVRIGAILTLDRIARENPGEHIRVMDILCAYIRENAPAQNAKDHDAPKPRTDIQVAITTIGNRDPERINREEAQFARGGETGYRLDLRETDLRKCDLSHLDLCNARLDWARMEGADLTFAHMEKAYLHGARLEGAKLWWTQLEGANLIFVQLNSANWTGAHIVSPAHFADLRGAHNLTQAQLDRMIGNEMTLLPDGPAPDTIQPYSIPSCWRELPSAFVELLGRYSYDWEVDMMGFLCPPGQEPARTGTPLPLDAPYPPGHPLADLHKTK